jgi:hypothetical protein
MVTGRIVNDGQQYTRGNHVSILHKLIHSTGQKIKTNSEANIFPRSNILFVNDKKLNDFEPLDFQD